MSSKSQKENQKKKERTSPVSLGRRPLSPAAATFDALSNPAYDTSNRMHSPPMPIPPPRNPPPEPRLHGLGISAPKPVRRTQSLEEIVMRSPSPSLERMRYPQEEVDDFQSSLEDFEDFKSVPAPDEPLKGGKKRKSRRRSKKNSKKKSKKKSSKKSKKRSNKRFNKKSKKARR